MRVVTVMYLATLLLLGCDTNLESEEKKSAESADFNIMDERTAVGEVPSIFGEDLTPEEKAEIIEKILPAGSESDTTPEERFQQLLSDAQGGSAEAQNGLGVMYYTGEVISKSASGEVLDNDPLRAVSWFLRAAEQGFADAQFNLGLMYVNGEGIAKNIPKAVELFRKAAEQGHVDAQNNLGALYYLGEGINRNTDEALKWFEKAAAQGNSDAKANLEAIKAQQ